MLETRERIMRLETAVFGWTDAADSGLLGKQGKDSKRIEALEQSLLQVRTIVRAARWLILSAAAAIAVTGSDHMASWLATGIRALAAVLK